MLCRGFTLVCTIIRLAYVYQEKTVLSKYCKVKSAADRRCFITNVSDVHEQELQLFI